MQQDQVQADNPLSQQQRKLAAVAQGLYLVNITILPIFAFIILIFLYFKNRASMHMTTLCHFRQSILANILSGFLLCVVSLVILLTGSFDSPYTWMILLLYFISIHSVLILYGVFGLIKALAGDAYQYPIIGKWWY